MTLQETITNLQPLPVARVIHLRDSLFLVGYGAAIIELRDLSKAKGDGSEPDPPLAIFDTATVDPEKKFEYLRDFDCKDGDESNIVMLFDSGAVGFLDLKTKKFFADELK